jgi:hypothetical protein
MLHLKKRPKSPPNDVYHVLSNSEESVMETSYRVGPSLVATAARHRSKKSKFNYKDNYETSRDHTDSYMASRWSMDTDWNG